MGRTNIEENSQVKFPPFSPSVAKKNLKLVCCDRCSRAEWVEAGTQASFCRCGTRRRPATKAELEQYRQSIAAAVTTPDEGKSTA
jgi:hypothetical protein